MKSNIIMLSKDALGKFYLPTYGNKRWETPNINQLASKGTVFNRFYTAAPSSAMAYFSMFTGIYPYQSKQKNYRPVSKFEGETLFDKAYNLGYDPHVIWDESWMTTAKLYSECYGNFTTFHPLPEIKQSVGAHYVHSGLLKPDSSKSIDTLRKLENSLKNIVSKEKPVFVWMHLPHVLNGFVGYGTDIELYDQVVGMIRKYFDDNNIFITADHGNMNGKHKKIGYGFDVYEEAICIPLITPRINNLEICDKISVNIDLYDLIFKRKVPDREYVYSDTAYYAQLSRKIAIIGSRYKYIYNKINKKEEMYDLIEDPEEAQNLISDFMYDVDRHLYTPLRELYFYEYWDILEEARKSFREEKNKIWKNENKFERMFAYYEKYGKIVKRKLNKAKKQLLLKKKQLKSGE